MQTEKKQHQFQVKQEQCEKRCNAAKMHVLGAADNQAPDCFQVEAQ